MGYSCTALADETRFRISEICKKEGNMQNTFKHNGNEYFFEVGRENADGSITGTIWKSIKGMNADGTPNEYGLIASSFRIEPNGEITKFLRFKKELSK